MENANEKRLKISVNEAVAIADELIRLRKENARLREALTQIDAIGRERALTEARMAMPYGAVPKEPDETDILKRAPQWWELARAALADKEVTS